MRVPDNLPKISGVYKNKRNVNSYGKSSGTEYKKDNITISNRAKDFQTVMRGLKDVPEMREDLVNEIKEKIESGNYNISGKDIIDKLSSKG